MFRNYVRKGVREENAMWCREVLLQKEFKKKRQNEMAFLADHSDCWHMSCHGLIWERVSK
jgi:hypothetical protein